MNQVHSKFKVFIVDPGEDGLVNDDVPQAISRFVDQHGVAAKSLGCEYDEKADKVIFTLGYAEGQGSYPVTLTVAELGQLPLEAATIEAALEKAALEVENVICHEFYVVNGHYIAVFLTKK